MHGMGAKGTTTAPGNLISETYYRIVIYIDHVSLYCERHIFLNLKYSMQIMPTPILHATTLLKIGYICNTYGCRPTFFLSRS